jgi:hypothetical protein
MNEENQSTTHRTIMINGMKRIVSPESERVLRSMGTPPYQVAHVAYHALIAMRSNARQQLSFEDIALQADLIHNVPMQMLASDGSAEASARIVQSLRDRASRNPGLAEWLELILASGEVRYRIEPC